MKNLTIARRYAKALLIIGKEDGQAETYGKELDGFTKMMSEKKELAQAIVNPIYGASGRKKVLETVVGKVGVSKVVASFLLLLFDKGRIDFLSDINSFYQKLADELKGVLRASLVSASALSSETVEKIRTTLSKRTGKDIILQVEQDPGLIGGIVSIIGDLVLDGSIKSQLLSMRESLKRGESI